MQTFSDWELIAVNDGSRDDSYDLLKAWAETDRRIRVIRLPENSGLSAAQTRPCGRPQGKWSRTSTTTTNTSPTSCSWSCGTDKGDVLVFGYDIVYDPAAGTDAERVESWDPGKARGISWSRTRWCRWGSHIGGRWWKRSGLSTRCCGGKRIGTIGNGSRGRARVCLSALEERPLPRAGQSLSRVPHLTARQRETAVANWVAGRPIFGDQDLGARKRPAAVNWNEDKAAAYWGSFGSSFGRRFHRGLQALTLTLG